LKDHVVDDRWLSAALKAQIAELKHQIEGIPLAEKQIEKLTKVQDKLAAELEKLKAVARESIPIEVGNKLQRAKLVSEISGQKALIEPMTTQKEKLEEDLRIHERLTEREIDMKAMDEEELEHIRFRRDEMKEQVEMLTKAGVKSTGLLQLVQWAEEGMAFEEFVSVLEKEEAAAREGRVKIVALKTVMVAQRSEAKARCREVLCEIGRLEAEIQRRRALIRLHRQTRVVPR
jgi:hypothetical protein